MISRATERRAFTLIELLIVISIIAVLAALILGTSGYVQQKGKRSRAEAEIAAMSAALESYKADNGIYPRHEQDTDLFNTRSPGAVDSATYRRSSRFLYGELSGDRDGNRVVDTINGVRSQSYFTFKPQMLAPRDVNQTVVAIIDPFSNSYGYSTANQADPQKGYNPTFDLWSTGGDSESGNTELQWIKNW